MFTSIVRRALPVAIALAFSASAAAQTVSAPQLGAPGKISFDARGMPTIQAQSDNDVAFLQGYAHAQARFFQMDLTRRQVSGTLAALVGQSQLANDVQARTLGLRRAAERSWAAMSDDTRGWIAAYASGVNHWLATNPLPLEYAALDLTRADAWTPVDTLCVGKGLAYQLSFDLDIDATIQLGAYQQAGEAGGFDGTALFFGDVHRSAPADDRVTVPGFEPGAGKSAATPKAAAAPTLGRIDPVTIDLARAYRASIAGNPLFEKALAGRDTPIGSNEWVVSGSLTASGKPILSNDPHLGLSLSPVFMEQHLSSAEKRDGRAMDVTGVTVPGAPGVIQGCNQTVCWGTTTNSLDVTDVFQETLRLNSFGLPVAIVHDGADEPLQWILQSYYVNRMDGTPDNVVRDESIGYANGALTLVVPRRNNGPIVQIDSANAQGLSIAYTGFGATQEIESFRRINRASNLDEFRDALTYFDFGSQNFAYADTAGNIAYFTSAEAPVRTDLQTKGAPGGGRPPWLIRDGSGALGHDWMPVAHPQPNQATPFEILPADEMPFVVNPQSGYFANANNDPIGFSLDNNPLNQLRPGGGLYYLDWGGASSLRMGRIDREIQAFKSAGHKITPADMQALQANTKALDAELLLPHLFAAYDHATAADAPAPLAQLAASANVAEAIERLRAWDYSTPTGIAQGYDAGDNPLALPQPGQAEIDASVAATLWASWRSHALRDTVDATLTQAGLGDHLPGAGLAFNGLKFVLDNFDALGGKSASGLSFFASAESDDAATQRDIVLLNSLRESLDALGSDAFAPAFAGSTNLADYRWGRLHRIVFDHPLGGPFSAPGQNGIPSPYGFTDLAEGLPGIARDGAWETVNVGNYDLRADAANGFMFGSGSARRFVGEMSATIGATEVIPGGNSGVLGSPNYVDQLPLWLTGHYHDLPIPASAAIAASVTTLNFQP
ncbi:penicillin acylase family protein [Dokdonella sp.]|uniref:penicillin acylase family protein n=1 Tax=Dokdonella sp. TaxID=2291710 RepID=UPI001AFD7752|nr:penicillin acylase family protein [Dokdonella sp.]MBO9662506.1 penicillin acylase family protein [Dokdonella sp.]